MSLNELVSPPKLWSRSEILTRTCPVPRQPGVYAWYFKRIPPLVPVDNCVTWQDLTLLYVGISPEEPKPGSHKVSSQTLYERIPTHYRGNAYGSTLRQSLGCLLREQLAITTGMRQAELFGLKWSDLQSNSGTLYVRRQVQRVSGGEWNYVEPKTRSGRRALKLGEETLHRLRLHRERQQMVKKATGDRWQENDLIFTSSVGTPLDPSNLRKDYIRVLMSAGLPLLRFHDLRHTAASLMLNHGIPVIVVSRRLGHAKASTTLDIYGHLLHEMQDEAARLMDELVTPQAVSLQVLQPVPKAGGAQED